MSDLISREDAIEVCTRLINDFDVMKPDGVTYEPAKVQRAAKGMVSLARQDIRALPAVQPDAHVSETPKSEHDARDVLTPAPARKPQTARGG